MMENLVPGFMGDEPAAYTNSVQIAQNPPDVPVLLPEVPFSHAEAVACDKRIDSTAKAFYQELRQMRDRQGWRVLGFTSWSAYLGKKANKAGVDRVTLSRRLEDGDERQELSEQGINPKNFNESQIRLLRQLPSPEIKAEAAKLAMTLSESNPPEGKAAEYHRPGKIYTEFVRQAVETLLPPADDDTDPFNPVTRQKVAAKPLPPTVKPVAPISILDRPLADFVCCEYKPGADVLFVTFRVAPGEEYEAWVPVREIEQVMKK